MNTSKKKFRKGISNGKKRTAFNTANSNCHAKKTLNWFKKPPVPPPGSDDDWLPEIPGISPGRSKLGSKPNQDVTAVLWDYEFELKFDFLPFTVPSPKTKKAYPTGEYLPPFKNPVFNNDKPELPEWYTNSRVCKKKKKSDGINMNYFQNNTEHPMCKTPDFLRRTKKKRK